MYPMCHPKYIYRPRSEEECLKQRKIMMKKLKIPDGYCRIFGAFAPIEFREQIRSVVNPIRTKFGKTAARKAVYAEIRRLRGYEDEYPRFNGVSCAYQSIDVNLPTTVGGFS